MRVVKKGRIAAGDGAFLMKERPRVKIFSCRSERASNARAPTRTDDFRAVPVPDRALQFRPGRTEQHETASSSRPTTTRGARSLHNHIQSTWVCVGRNCPEIQRASVDKAGSTPCRKGGQASFGRLRTSSANGAISRALRMMGGRAARTLDQRTAASAGVPASIWLIASTTASKVSMVDGWRAL